MKHSPDVYQLVVNKLNKAHPGFSDKLLDYYSKATGISKSFIDASNALCWYINNGMSLKSIINMVA